MVIDLTLYSQKLKDKSEKFNRYVTFENYCVCLALPLEMVSQLSSMESTFVNEHYINMAIKSKT